MKKSRDYSLPSVIHKLSKLYSVTFILTYPHVNNNIRREQLDY
ncbi:hypothetical protein BAOM_5123 [Peribacillus asahii]|uniref:Uncharacterized protein n=1 Tax=Peribacillus asahii TaxID=228899 RepID=A0A3Q9RSH5_9BACI|nr:hypothetical protein BAOM_5123 [Peribacillus asahii]